MSEKHELEIEIGPSGEVKVHVKGAKGRKCLDYVQLFATVGEVVSQTPTPEMYEPPAPVTISREQQIRSRGGESER